MESSEVGEQTSGQVGVFQSLLNFRVASGDKVLEEHLTTSSRNAKYTSSPIQNEIIDACGKVITQKLAMRIKESGFFPSLPMKLRIYQTSSSSLLLLGI